MVAKRQRREKSSAGFGSSFYVFPPPLGSLCKLGQPGVLFVLPEVLTLVLGPSFVYFAGFPLLCFLAMTILNSFFLFYLPNTQLIPTRSVLEETLCFYWEASQKEQSKDKR